MRVWLYDTLTNDPGLIDALNEEYPDRTLGQVVIPRQSQLLVPKSGFFIVYGLGNNTNEDLAEDTDHIAHRQFFQVWVHHKSGTYNLIDHFIPLIKNALVNASNSESMVTETRWLETSAEFESETYETLFRYIRFQSIISKGATS